MGKDFDLLAQLATFARDCNIPLTDPNITERYAADVEPRLQAAIKDQNLVYGMRTERLFEAMIISLGKFRLFKSEDNGMVHGSEGFRAPDFRIVLESGAQWLIEVKNVHREDTLEQVSRMSPDYLASLRRYSDAVGSPLLVAHFWSKWGMWTLVEIEHFTTQAGGLRVEMAQAFLYSKMGDLGDVSINLPGPLELKIQTKTGDGALVQQSAEIYRENMLLTDPRDQMLAMILLQFGNWILKETTEDDVSGNIKTVIYKAEPQEPSDQGFDGIGHASSIFSRFYRADTSAEGQVTQLHGEPKPEWFTPLSRWDFEASKLELRIFSFQARADNSAACD